METRMKSRFVTALAVLAISAPVFATELVEKIVARVNDRLITNSEFVKRMDTVQHGPAPVPTGLKPPIVDFHAWPQ